MWTVDLAFNKYLPIYANVVRFHINIPASKYSPNANLTLNLTIMLYFRHNALARR